MKVRHAQNECVLGRDVRGGVQWNLRRLEFVLDRVRAVCRLQRELRALPRHARDGAWHLSLTSGLVRSLTYASTKHRIVTRVRTFGV
jgi:hypothetical protein